MHSVEQNSREASIIASRLKDSRVLMVMNLLNGVPAWQIGLTYHMDASEVEAIFRFAMSKVKDYLFRKCKPPIFCDTLEEAKKDRVNIIAILPKLNLDKEPEYKRIVTEKVTDGNTQSMINDNLRRKS